jgi:hypothetical protein
VRALAEPDRLVDAPRPPRGLGEALEVFRPESGLVGLDELPVAWRQA